MERTDGSATMSMTDNERAAIERLRKDGVSTQAIDSPYCEEFLSDGGAAVGIRINKMKRLADRETVAGIALREHRTDFDVADDLREAQRLLGRTSRFLMAREHADGDLYSDIDAFLARTSRHEQPSGDSHGPG